MFYCWCFLFVCFRHFAALYLRAPSADRRETFRHDWKCVNLDNAGTKIGRRRPRNFFWGNCFFPNLGPKSPSSLDRSPWNFAKWRAIGGASKVGLKIWVSREKIMWGSQNSKFCVKFSVLRRITLGPVGIMSPNLSTWCAAPARQGWKLGYTFFGACTLKISGRPNWRNFGLL